MFGWFKKKKTESPAPQTVSLQDILFGLLEAHGLKAEKYQDWVLVDNDLPVLRGTLVPQPPAGNSQTYMLEFELRLGEQRIIIERYAGIGEDENSAIGQGVYKFCAGAFHIFLSAFWDHHEPEQVDIETWTIGGHPWSAYIGSLISNASTGQKAGFPKTYMNEVQAYIQDLELDTQVHWVSIFFANHKGALTCEALFDNDYWPELSQHLVTLDWPHAEGYYSQRLFILLKPADGTAPTVYSQCAPIQPSPN